MVTLERRKRKGPLLTPSSLPCLGDMPTINVTAGCAHGCAYCYAKGYSGYPGEGRVVLFDNVPELVRKELRRKRRRPRRVYFSPSSDAFQPLPEVQEVTYETMSILLGAGVEIAFLTKGAIEDRFLALFSVRATRVFAQIGITTLDERLWRALEPAAAPPARRLANMEDLAQIGIASRARLDPLIPDLTDTEESLSMLLAALSARGVRSIAASFVFFRAAFGHRLSEQLHRFAGAALKDGTWAWHQLGDGLGGGRMIGPADRRARLERLGALAAKHGIETHVCACKNPDLARGSYCRIAGPSLARQEIEVGPLFPTAR